MKNKGRIRFEMPGMEIVANTKFLSAFFMPYILKMNPVFGYQYNKTTRIASENVYNYLD